MILCLFWIQSLVLLDLSMAFDIVGHYFVLECLESRTLHYSGLHLTMRIGLFHVVCPRDPF